jgi:F-type H+-transporting ATPase subunit gamma
MSDTAASLHRKINSAGDLQSVVRTMKAMAASSIGQYENAVRSLDDYYRTVQLGLIACFHQDSLHKVMMENKPQNKSEPICAIVFGSDQGLVGQFNEVVEGFVVKTLQDYSGKKTIWTVGERIHASMSDKESDTSLSPQKNYELPNSISSITALVGKLLIAIEAQREKEAHTQVYLFYNQPKSDAIYAPVMQRLLPLDSEWMCTIATIPWPSQNLPEVMNDNVGTLFAFVREYLFVSLYRACAESLASENASRLAAMQRAEKNIDELLEDLNRSFNQMRQSAIDEELFDVISGFEALSKI